MDFAFTTEPAEFIDRPNRFLILARLRASGEVVRVHCPDPGRLRELLLPSVALHVSRADGPLRTTTHTVRFVEHPANGVLVSLDSCLANGLFLDGLCRGLLEPFNGYARLEREVSITSAVHAGVRSRIDYRLTGADGARTWVEVKSATLVEDGTAYFPDAVTARGVRHLQELQTLVRAGDRAAVCFVVQRPDATAFRPQWDRDPVFAQALLGAAENGVDVYAYTANICLAGCGIEGRIPVYLERV
jgi:sugar fermentation stimulation protein A